MFRARTPTVIGRGCRWPPEVSFRLNLWFKCVAICWKMCQILRMVRPCRNSRRMECGKAICKRWNENRARFFRARLRFIQACTRHIRGSAVGLGRFARPYCFLFPDVFSPQIGLLALQALHQCDAARVVNYGEFNAISAHPCLCAHEGSVFTNDNARDFEQDGST